MMLTQAASRHSTAEHEAFRATVLRFVGRSASAPPSQSREKPDRLPLQ
jgi:hypothetical protein